MDPPVSRNRQASRAWYGGPESTRWTPLDPRSCPAPFCPVPGEPERWPLRQRNPGQYQKRRLAYPVGNGLGHSPFTVCDRGASFAYAWGEPPSDEKHHGASRLGRKRCSYLDRQAHAVDRVQRAISVPSSPDTVKPRAGVTSPPLSDAAGRRSSSFIMIHSSHYERTRRRGPERGTGAIRQRLKHTTGHDG
jgi:hypothetical protein